MNQQGIHPDTALLTLIGDLQTERLQLREVLAQHRQVIAGLQAQVAALSETAVEQEPAAAQGLTDPVPPKITEVEWGIKLPGMPRYLRFLVREGTTAGHLYWIDGDGVHHWSTERFKSQEEAAVYALDLISQVYAPTNTETP